MATAEDEELVSRGVAVGLLVVGSAVFVTALVLVWRQPLLDGNAFRQTQTATAAYWLDRGGPFLAYETPVLGAPWSVPFEFPLYQAIVVGVHRLGIDLDAAGRLVSSVFFALALWQLHAIVRKLGGSRRLATLLCGVVLTSPLYLSVSCSFMIESLALFFALAFVSAVASQLRTPTARIAIAMALCASLAAVIKVTTFLPFAAAGAGVVAWDLVAGGHWDDRRRWLERYLPILAAGVMAMIVLSVWTHYADAVKADQPFGRSLQSSALTRWVYGTVAQRLSLTFWQDVVFGRALRWSLGGALPLAVAAVVACLFGRVALSWAAALLALYLLPFLVFTNLHLVHQYYQYANGLFAIGAVVMVAWQGRSGWQRWVGGALIALLVASQVWELAVEVAPGMFSSRRDTRTMQLSAALADLPPDGVLLIAGYDWSPEIPYYTRHRAVMIPDWSTAEQIEALRTRMPTLTEGRPVVAVIECPNRLRQRSIGPAVDALISEQTHGRTVAIVARCSIWR